MEKRLGDVVLKIEGVSLGFGGVKALSDVSFELRKHEILAIIGPNGAGKSSMLNCINGFYHPQQGRITYKGVTRQAMRPHVAAVYAYARTADRRDAPEIGEAPEPAEKIADGPEHAPPGCTRHFIKQNSGERAKCL